MIKNILFYSLVGGFFGFSQTKATIVDSLTQEKIPYVNIWVENQEIGTTANENGFFEIENIDASNTLILSAMGYADKKIKVNAITKTIVLQPKTEQLKEVIVYANKNTEELIVDKLEVKKVNSHFVSNKKPVLIAKFYPYDAKYEKTPFLKKIKVLTKSEVKEAKFNVRLYKINEKGEPEGYLYDENIIGIAKKGRKVTEIDVSKLKIEFPKEGFFVVMEGLIIESNKEQVTYTMYDSNKKYKGVNYYPFFGVIPTDSNENSWLFGKENWMKMFNNKLDTPQKKYQNKYNLVATELTLTN